MIKSAFEKNFETIDSLPIGEKAKHEFKRKEEHLRFTKRRKELGLDLDNCWYNTVLAAGDAEARKEYARNLAELYFGLGFLSNGTFVSTRIGELVGEYVGQSAANAQAKINEAAGGLLFVDGVDSVSGADFSVEALSTILMAMETERGKTIIIVGGESLKNIFKCCPLLESKFEKFNLDE